MLRNIVIVCPTHKEYLNDEEFTNLKITERSNPSVEKIFLIPDNISTIYYESKFHNWKVKKLDCKWFKSELQYNRLLLSSVFYEIFFGYSELLINQTDAFLVKDVSNLPTKYDYLGAPWNPKINILGCIKLEMGNGGLSYRKVRKFYWITKLMFFLRFSSIHEDIIFSLLCKIGFLNTSRNRIKNQYFIETTSANLTELSPDTFGFHALEKFNPNLQRKIHQSYKFK